MSTDLVFLSDVDSYEHENFFIASPVKDRLHIERLNRLRLRKVRRIASIFLLSWEKVIFEMCLFHNDIRDLLCFVHSDDIGLVKHKIKKVLFLLKKFVDFFENNEYKKIDCIVKKILLLRQYEFLKMYLRLHHYRRCACIYGVTFQAIRDRIERIIVKLQRDSVCAPLVDLIRFLQNYKYNEKNSDYL